MCRMRRWHRTWKESSLFQSAGIRELRGDTDTVETQWSLFNALAASPMHWIYSGLESLLLHDNLKLLLHKETKNV